MAAVTQTVVNGVVYDFANVEVKCNGDLYLAVTEISYSHKLEPGKLRGTGPKVLGRTTGEYEAEGSMTMSKGDAAALRTALGNGYMTKSFDIIVTYAPSSMTMLTDTLKACRIKGDENSHKTGSDPLTEKLELDVYELTLNGITPI